MMILHAGCMSHTNSLFSAFSAISAVNAYLEERTPIAGLPGSGWLPGSSSLRRDERPDERPETESTKPYPAVVAPATLAESATRNKGAPRQRTILWNKANFLEDNMNVSDL